MRDMVVLVELNGACCRSMARKLRAEHIYCKILPATATAEEILAQDPLGVLLAGGDTGEPAVFPEGMRLDKNRIATSGHGGCRPGPVPGPGWIADSP